MPHTCSVISFYAQNHGSVICSERVESSTEPTFCDARTWTPMSCSWCTRCSNSCSSASCGDQPEVRGRVFWDVSGGGGKGQQLYTPHCWAKRFLWTFNNSQGYAPNPTTANPTRTTPTPTFCGASAHLHCPAAPAALQRRSPARRRLPAVPLAAAALPEEDGWVPGRCQTGRPGGVTESCCWCCWRCSCCCPCCCWCCTYS